MPNEQAHPILLALDQALYAEALAQWRVELDNDFKDLRAYHHVNAMGAIRLLLQLSPEERERWTIILAKWGRDYLQEVDPSFFSQADKEITQEYLNRVGRLTVPGGDPEITAMRERRWALKRDKNSRKVTVAIRRKLIQRVKSSMDQWPGYTLSHPEPSAYAWSRATNDYRISTEWDFHKAWEFDYDTSARKRPDLQLANNLSIVYDMGIGANPSFTSEEEANEAFEVSMRHGLRMNALIVSVLKENRALLEDFGRQSARSD